MSKSPLRRVFPWGGSAEENQPNPPGAAELAHFRRSSRIKKGVLVKVSGQDGSGAEFVEDVRTVDIGKHGARFLITRQVSPGAALTIDNAEAGRKAAARVVWAHPTPSQQSFSTGIEIQEQQFEDPEQVWKIESPPADWIEGCAPPTPDERLEYLCQRARATTAERTAAPRDRESEADRENEGPRKPVPPPRAPGRNANLTLLGLRAELGARGTAAAPVATQEAGGHAPGGSAVGASAGSNGNTVLVSEATAPATPVLNAAALEPPEVEAPAVQVEEILRAVEQKAAETSSPAPPGPGSEGNRAQRESEERTAALLPQLSAELKESGSAVVLQVREQLAHMTLKSIEILNQKVESGSEEFRKRMAGALEEQFAARAKAVAGEIRRATEVAGADLEKNQKALEDALEARTREHEQRLGESAASSLESIARQSDSLVERFQGRLDSTLETFEQKAATHLESLLDKMTTQFEQSWAARAEKQAESMAVKLGEKLNVSASAIVGEAKNELAAVTKSSLESVTQATAKECERQLERIFREHDERVSGAAEAAVTSIKLAAEGSLAELRTAREQMTADFKASAAGYQEQLHDIAARGMDSLDSKSKSLLEGFETRMGSSLRIFEEKAGRELDAVLGRVSTQAQEKSAKAFEAHAEETEKKLRQGLTAAGQSVVDDARRLAGVTQQALDQLSQDAAEQCRKRIEDFRGRTAVFQKQIDQTASRDSTFRAAPDAMPAPVKPAARKKSSSPLATAAIIAVLIVILVPAAIALYLFTRPVMRLRAEPPSGFEAVNPAWSPKRKALEDQLARAYWERAVQDVQTTYHYGSVLPADPPADFDIDPEVAAKSGTRIDLAATRTRYWEKVREAWGEPQAWEQADTWNTEWLARFTSSSQAASKPGSDSSGQPAPAPAKADQQ